MPLLSLSTSASSGRNSLPAAGSHSSRYSRSPTRLSRSAISRTVRRSSELYDRNASKSFDPADGITVSSGRDEIGSPVSCR